MARPRAFDRDQVLRQAIQVFCDKGFAAASTEELMQAMGLSRQSMYNTFGDKRQLYLLAMAEYQRSGVDDLIERLSQGPTPLHAIHDTLYSLGTGGCMGVNAICEFGQDDVEVNQLNEQSAARLRKAFEQTLIQALEQGELGANTDVAGACDFLMATLVGMKVSSKGGASVEQLGNIALYAVRALGGRG
ncbi:TetR family transcriptional regulator [Pseudomonas sp. CCM 7893]|uniref:TetR family transcriptional regulator n=1 Tax=Pseudomonas spelaei TaxID=1055469 RepID=A0A6I3W035_9PSED|nr:TetR/AcrR family transcriptional regulator [Pseudomonas spelaei]MUF03535.1 TetR family transcriptional regulator [Pseudomonas spelaei]QLG92602.1 TetR/AcrR family transcriptional regulator [Pseudomonas yamanorum]